MEPNGRFKTNKRLCLSISDFHPDTWNPAWSVATILTGLLSFMLETTPTLGSCESTLYEKKKFARNSLEFNMKNEVFKELFPEICDEINERLKKIEEYKKQNSVNSNSPVNNVDSNETDGENPKQDSTTDDNSIWHSLCTNMIVLVGFVLFALVVHYVIKTINIE